MKSVDALISNNSLLDKMAVRLNRLLHHEESQFDKSLELFDTLFENAAGSMSTDQDKQVLELLKHQMKSFIGITLGVPQFVSNEDEWLACKDRYEQQGIDIYAPERLEHERIRRELEEERYDEKVGSGEEEDDDDDNDDKSNEEEEDDNDDESNEEEEVQVKSREMNSNGFQTVSRQKKKKKKTTTTTYNVTNNSYTSNRPYRRQQVIKCEFYPEYMACNDLNGDIFCMPVFFPSEESYRLFHSALSTAKETLYVCVFSLTDNDTAGVLIDAKKRGVDVRIITDNDQMDAYKGADVIRLYEQHSIPFKKDDGEQFMHNKFAVIDQKMVITGSFNWSAGARYKNRENIIITNIPSVVNAYDEEFNKLWRYF
ncbi:uncharacterized protein BX663DRAFT_515802 [Cokeromyces recurvatus]|uniref:uncharacterized protein n=1 Tax=Cokeromyces recurvatus TaxID=90255 RepID=UPI00221F30CA|nr:uncharacterized protein BX663DRAFT_515802 [Cokeromyces recurvatus]KAI7900944.1 hypothetical protein BX663DRAFT_515802 [Cokeromyces recurvatus]